MSSSNEKKEFDWKKGGVLDEENSAPLGGVRTRGLPKLKKAVHAEPAKRKEEREKLILKEQTKPYQEKSKKDKEVDGAIVIEESQSGLSDDFETSEAKKLIDKGKKIKGLDRFGKKK